MGSEMCIRDSQSNVWASSGLGALSRSSTRDSDRVSATQDGEWAQAKSSYGKDRRYFVESGSGNPGDVTAALPLAQEGTRLDSVVGSKSEEPTDCGTKISCRLTADENLLLGEETTIHGVDNDDKMAAAAPAASVTLAPHGCSQSCLLYTSPSPRDGLLSRMPSSA